MKMNVASCGMGLNSVAGIIEATNRGIRFDEILFANTGRGKQLGERQLTYEYIKIFNRWLIAHDQPAIKMLHSKNVDGKIITLYEECLKLGTLPSIVFGFKTCSQRFKIAPQDKFLNSHPLAKEVWGNGDKVTKWIFYDADEPQRAKDYSDEKFKLRYFLIENDLGRYECEQIVIDAGLPLPHKSACKFCPSTKPYQIIELYLYEPKDFWEAIALERHAIKSGKMNDVKGLGRDFSWEDLIKAYRKLEKIKKNPISGERIEAQTLRLMKKINNSKPKKLKPRSTAKEIICDLFSVKQNMPCGCYDAA